MIEALALIVTVLAARILATPLLRRIQAPAWWSRLRARKKPGVPVLTLLGAPVLMVLLWLVGERRGIPGAVLWVLWIAIPLAAFEIMRSWLRRP